MDHHKLKLGLLERIVRLDDGSLLLAVKRLLDDMAPDAGPDALPTLKDPVAHYGPEEDRSYSAAEVRALLSTVLNEMEAEANSVDEEELAGLDASRDRFLRGEGRWYTLDELETRMKERSRR